MFFAPLVRLQTVVLWVFAGVHKKHQTHNHKRPSRGNKCLGNLCREKGVAWYSKKGGDCLGNQDPPEQEHAGECEA